MHVNGSRNVMIDLRINPLPFPEPSKITIKKNGQWIPVSRKYDGFTLINDSVLFFDEITKDHAGMYYLTATNYHLDNSSREVGTFTGNFTLNVICECQFL